MPEQRSPIDSEGRQPGRELLASRRRFLEAAGAAGVVVGVGGLAYGSQGEPTFEFGGEVGGWQGRAPDAIAGETNPTLELEPGQTYTVVWENTDGVPHNFVVETADGEQLVETEIVSEQGETQTVEFEASEEMAEYYCEVHPTSMRGEIHVGAAEGDDEEPGEAARFVPEGPSVGVELVADGPLVNPTTFRSVPGAEDTHLVVDQPGQVYVLQDGELREEPLLEIGDEIVFLGPARGEFDRPEGFDERGLLGFAFHPEFEENGRLYIRYSSRNPVTPGTDLAGPGDRSYPEDWDHIEVLSEVQVADDEELRADFDTERVLLEIPSPQFNHNSGEVVFGPDGYLYMGMGDGGDGNDTGVGHVDDWYDGNEGGNAQNVEANLLGTVLRIDVDGEAEDRPYGVPNDNPLVGTSAHDEIFAYGLRNPWRMSFDGDRLIAADVGQHLFEEVDVIESGGNYGWNVTEGFHCFDAADARSPAEECPDAEPDEAPYDGSEFVDPVLEYPHRYQDQAVGISITGGYVYEGDGIEDLGGRYVFGDWSASFVEPQGRIFAATPAEDAEAVDLGGNGNATDADGNETEVDGNETRADGNETDGEEDGGQSEPSPAEQVEVPTPDEQPWQWSEVTIEGGEGGQLNRFVQGFGRATDGRLYLLASRTGRLEGTGGELYRLVPAGEGEAVEAPDVDIAEPGDGDDGEDTDGANETATNETATNETAGNETAGNETTGNETAGNETAGNETGG